MGARARSTQAGARRLWQTKMTDELHTTLFGQSSVRYGTVSLIAACLAFLSQWLVMLVGVFLCLVALIPLALIGSLSGLLGIGTGLYYRQWPGCVAGTMGVVIIGFVIWSFTRNITQF